MNRPIPDGPLAAVMLPNLLSLARLAILPVFLLSLCHDGPTTSWTTLWLLALGAATDFADGFLARRLGQISRMGRVLDPLADKICLGSGAVALCVWRGFPMWLVCLQVGRDLAILLAGLFLLRARDLVPSANVFGKAATVCMALTFLAYLLSASPPLAAALVWASAALLLLSGLSYLVLLRRLL